MKHSQHSHGEILFHINENPLALRNDKARREYVNKRWYINYSIDFNMYIYSYVNVY